MQQQQLYKIDVTPMSQSQIKSYVEKMNSINKPLPADAVGLNIHFPVTQGPLYEYAMLCNRTANEYITISEQEPTITFGPKQIPHITVAMMAIRKEKVSELVTLIRGIPIEPPIEITSWSAPEFKGNYIMIWDIQDNGSINAFLENLFPLLREFIHPHAFSFYPPWLKFNSLASIKTKIQSIRRMGSPNILNFEPHLTVAHSKTPVPPVSSLFPEPPKSRVQLLDRIDIRRSRLSNGSVIRNSLPTHTLVHGQAKPRELTLEQQISLHLQPWSQQYEKK
jgi:2'-5' RNA ligase